MVTPHLPWKFHANRSSHFLVMLLKKKQRNKERNKLWCGAQQTPPHSECNWLCAMAGDNKNLTFDPPTRLPELTQNLIRSFHGHSTPSLKISFSRNVADKEINKQRNRSKTIPRPPTGGGVKINTMIGVGVCYRFQKSCWWWWWSSGWSVLPWLFAPWTHSEWLEPSCTGSHGGLWQRPTEPCQTAGSPDSGRYNSASREQTAHCRSTDPSTATRRSSLTTPCSEARSAASAVATPQGSLQLPMFVLSFNNLTR